MIVRAKKTIAIVPLTPRCTGSRRVVKPLAAKDRQFIEDYKKLLKGFPKAHTAVSGLVEGNPQAKLKSTSCSHWIK